MADRVTVHDRVQVLDQLDGAAWWLNTMAAWLGEQGCETEADTVQSAAHACLASCWWLGRNLRPQPPPERWHDGGGMGLTIPYQQRPDQQR